MRNALAIFVICILIGVGAGTVACVSMLKEINHAVQTTAPSNTSKISPDDNKDEEPVDLKHVTLEEKNSKDATPPPMTKNNPSMEEASIATEEVNVEGKRERERRSALLSWVFDNQKWGYYDTETDTDVQYYFRNNGVVTLYLEQKQFSDEEKKLLPTRDSMQGWYRVDPLTINT